MDPPVHVLLVHLGPAKPKYLKDCVEQIRLWNPDPERVIIWLITEDIHTTDPFFTDLSIRLVSVSSLQTTHRHKEFKEVNVKDLSFGQGYWTFVKERFYFLEELILRENLTNCVHMEYDVMIYGDLPSICKRLSETGENRIRYGLDNPFRGHPGWMYIPSIPSYTALTEFFTYLEVSKKSMTDIEAMAVFWANFPQFVRPLPFVPEKLQREDRCSPSGQVRVKTSEFLHTDAKAIGCIFDSAVMGHHFAGIDPRNTGGVKISSYQNESALYTADELQLDWSKEKGLWKPYALGTVPVFTIHVHSKALLCLRSDRFDRPKADWDINEVYPNLLPYN